MYLRKLFRLCFLIICFFLSPIYFTYAQIQSDEPPQLAAGVAQIFVTKVDTTSTPTVILQMHGVDQNGYGMNFTDQSLLIRHGETTARNVRVVERKPIGTFTLFVLDITGGTDEQRLTVQQAIENYSTPAYMAEQIDFVAVYQVGELAAEELLPPTGFHNSIKNLFAAPLSSQSGSTALFDTIAGLINNGHSLRPRSDMAVSIVVISDGTDQVSENSLEELDQLANGTDIPVHTIWLENLQFSSFAKELGQNNLQSLANAGHGTYVPLADLAQVNQIWERIASFRNHTKISYEVDEPKGGSYPVQISLLDNPAVQTMIQVEIPNSAPTIQLDIPSESQEFNVASLEEPIKLGITTRLSWLDGQERELITAQLLVNGVVTQEIEPTKIGRFDALVDNFVYGNNTVQVAIVDNAGGRATSPEIILTINEGKTELPEQIKPKASIGTEFVALVQFFSASFLVASLLWGLWYMTAKDRKKGGLDSFKQLWSGFGKVGEGQSEKSSFIDKIKKVKEDKGKWEEVQVPDAAAPLVESAKKTASQPTGESVELAGVFAYLEIVESITRMPQYIDLTHNEMWIGRSQAQAQIVFENDITVSRQHAVLVQEGSSYRIYNQSDSSNSQVNGRAVGADGVVLRDGDELRLGAVVLRFRY